MKTFSFSTLATRLLPLATSLLLSIPAMAGAINTFTGGTSGTGAGLNTDGNWSPGLAPTSITGTGSYTDLLFNSPINALTDSSSNIHGQSWNVTNGASYTITPSSAAVSTLRAGTTGNATVKEVIAPFTNAVSNVAQDLVYLTNSSNLSIAVGISTGATFQIRQSGKINISAGSKFTVDLPVSYNGNSSGTSDLTFTGQGTTVFTSLTGSYTGSTTISAGTLKASSLKNVSTASSLGAPALAKATIAIGGATNTGALEYTGTGDSTNRVIDLAGTTGGATLTQSGSGALVYASAMTATGAGSKTLTLSGSSSGTGELAGAIVNNSAGNTTSLVKSGSGTWTLSGANTYTGSTTVNGGTLTLKSAYLANTSDITVATGAFLNLDYAGTDTCLLYTSPSPRD